MYSYNLLLSVPAQWRGITMPFVQRVKCKTFPWEQYKQFSYSYPGHIHKARRQFKKMLKDKRIYHFVLEARDARLQYLDHPDLHHLRDNVKKMVVFTKLDLLSKEAQSQLFKTYPNSFYYSNRDTTVGNSLSHITNWIINNASTTHEQQLVHVVGYPNVGKSALINQFRAFAHRKSGLRTGNVAGITRHIQKVRFLDNPKIDLVDFPGALVPMREIEFEDAIKLSLIGSCEFVNTEKDPHLEAHYLLCYLRDFEPDTLTTLKLEPNLDYQDSTLLLEMVGTGFNIFKKGNEVDLEKTAKFIVQRYRNGKITSSSFRH